jgi:hypothetical protein
MPSFHAGPPGSILEHRDSQRQWIISRGSAQVVLVFLVSQSCVRGRNLNFDRKFSGQPSRLVLFTPANRELHAASSKSVFKTILENEIHGQ